MGRFVEGEDRRQDFLLPRSLDDYVSEDNPVRVVEAFIGELDFPALGFAGATPAQTGRPAYHPSTMLKIYLYGYLNRIQSSRRLEREAQRNVELMWLTGRLAPDFKTIANFRRDNGAAIRAVCSQFVLLCRRLSLFGQATVAIDGSKFKAVNNRDRNYTAHKAEKRKSGSSRSRPASSAILRPSIVPIARSATSRKRGSTRSGRRSPAYVARCGSCRGWQHRLRKRRTARCR